jgi:hypothetical protein
MDKILQQITTVLQGLSTRQKLLLAGSTAVVAAALWIFVLLLGAGDYKNPVWRRLMHKTWCSG